LAKNRDTEAAFASAGLILFNAVSAYELMASGHSLSPIVKRARNQGSWKAAFREAFVDAYAIDYEAIFFYAIKVIDALPTSPLTEHILEVVFQASQHVVSKAGLLRHDLAGRIYHSALGRGLAKAFATYYTGIPSGELLAWISVEKWNDHVADFACGSGTLLLSAYHRKMSTAFFDQSIAGTTVDQLHKLFVEEHLVGLDAMPFAAHLTLVNLAMQQPSSLFTKSRIYHVPVGHKGGLGSLDLLKSNAISIQRRLSGKSIGPTQANMLLPKGRADISFPPESFDVVIMNPPFTKKQRVSQVVDEKALKQVVKGIGDNFTSLGGLALPFILLGDKYVKPGGRLALVIPSSILDRSTWMGVRNMIIEKYDLEHIVVSWIPGQPSFSEDTNLREILLVIRKKDKKRKTTPLLVTHIDVNFAAIEARQMADQMSYVLSTTKSPTVRSTQNHALHIGSKVLGEMVSFPKTLIENSVDNWYRLISFRNQDLIRASLVLTGLMSSTNPPYGFDFSRMITKLKDLADVGLFIKQVSSAGFSVLSSKPTTGSLKCLMTSDYDTLTLEDASCSWLVKNPVSKSDENFKPGKGHLLLPRKLNMYSTAKVVSIVSEEMVGGNMWIPVEPHEVETLDGMRLNAVDVSKIISLWTQSSYGMLTLVSVRHEIEGAWSEWVTEDIRELPVLDPRALNSSQTNALTALWDSISKVQWEALPLQYVNARGNGNHPRRQIDAGLASILLPNATPDLDKLYNDTKADLEKLGALM